MKTPKRSRHSAGADLSGALKTPKMVLENYLGQKRHTSAAEKLKILQAINSCIVHAANAVDESLVEDAFETLENLLELDINLNESDAGILDKIGGPALHLAAKLNVPRAVRLLCENGASLTYNWESKNPLEVIKLPKLKTNKCCNIIDTY